MSRLVPPDAFKRAARKADEAQDIAHANLTKLGRTGEGLLRAHAPRKATGEYAAGIHHEIQGDELRVFSSARHREEVEHGRRPGRQPPARAIARRLGVPIRDAFAIARSIGRKGTPGQHPVQRTQAAMSAAVGRTAGDIARDLRRAVEGK